MSLGRVVYHAKDVSASDLVGNSAYRAIAIQGVTQRRCCIAYTRADRVAGRCWSDESVRVAS